MMVRLSSCNTKELVSLRAALTLNITKSENRENPSSERSYDRPDGYKFVTGEEVKRILDLYSQGLSASEVGRQVDRPLRTVTDVLRRNGIKIRKHTPTGVDVVTKMVQLYESGMSCARIAKTLGVSSSNVGKHLQDAGVIMRSKSEAAILRSKRDNA